jgi:hypothetical protein
LRSCFFPDGWLPSARRRWPVAAVFVLTAWWGTQVVFFAALAVSRA